MLNRSWICAGFAAVLALQGCSTGTGGTPAPASAGPTSPTAPSPSATAAAPAGDFTKQGSKLKLGDKAVVPFKATGKTGAIGITVKSIDKGTESDLASLDLGDKVKGMSPYYVRVTVSNESGTDFAYSSVSLLRGTLAGGEAAQDVSVIGKFEKCDNGSADKSFTSKGATYDTCVLTLAQGTPPVIGAEYSSGSYAAQAPGTDYGDEPVVWQP
jgi:hypothetical protein